MEQSAGHQGMPPSVRTLGALCLRANYDFIHVVVFGVLRGAAAAVASLRPAAAVGVRRIGSGILVICCSLGVKKTTPRQCCLRPVRRPPCLRSR
jgi:hypothetical protein